MLTTNVVSHETLSDYLLLFIFLLILQNWLAGTLRRQFHLRYGANVMPIINDQTISLILGLVAGVIWVATKSQERA